MQGLVGGTVPYTLKAEKAGTCLRLEGRYEKEGGECRQQERAKKGAL